VLLCLLAGLIAQALHELLLISNNSNSSSSSSAAGRVSETGPAVNMPAETLDPTAAVANSHKILHHRMHERYSGAAAGSNSSSSSSSSAGAAAAAAGAVPVGVVSAEELQGINSVVRQVRCQL
jgi:hypothetical protein